MRVRRTATLALVALASSARAQNAPPAPTILTRCAVQSAHRVGLAALSAACPDLQQALQQLHLTAQLPPGWRKTLTATDLDALARLTQRYGGSPPRSLAQAPLRDIARALRPEKPEPSGWSRWMKWLRDRGRLLLHRARSWFGSLSLKHSQPALTRDLTYTLAALVLMALVALALRFARKLLPLGARPKSGSRGQAVTSAADPGPEWSTLAHHPAAWLRALIDALTRSHRLDAQAGLTYRELARSARFDCEAQRADFQRIAILAERQTYGPSGTEEIPKDAWSRAQTLHGELRAPPRAAETEGP